MLEVQRMKESVISFLSLNGLKSTVLNETYYGSSPELKRVEVLFAKIKENVISGKSPSDTKEMVELRGIIGKMFGFEKVVFDIIPEESGMNAFTIPLFIEEMFPDPDNYKVKKTKHGVMYSVPANKALYIYMTSFTVKNLSPRELTAVLLHEIGHNFYLIEEHYMSMKFRWVVNTICNILFNLIMGIATGDFLSIIVAVSSIFTLVKYANSPQKGVDEQMRAQIRSFDKKIDIGPIQSFFMKFFGILSKVITVTVGGILGIIIIPLLLLNKLFIKIFGGHSNHDYTNEKFSDSFATSYGYGVEIASVFSHERKLTWLDQKYSDSFLYQILDSQYKTMTEGFMSFSDPHPARQKRVELAAQKLEYELEHNRDKLLPAHIREIENQLKQIRVISAKSAEARPAILKALEDNLGLVEDKDKAFTDTVDDKAIFDYQEKIMHIIK
jgi:hypothetical protein